MKITGYRNRLLRDESQKNEEKLYNLARLSKTISTHEGLGNKIKDFFWFVYTSADDLDERILEDENTVKIMTVHKFKVLEFPVVFLCSPNLFRLLTNLLNEDIDGEDRRKVNCALGYFMPPPM